MCVRDQTRAAGRDSRASGTGWTILREEEKERERERETDRETERVWLLVAPLCVCLCEPARARNISTAQSTELKRQSRSLEPPTHTTRKCCC